MFSNPLVWVVLFVVSLVLGARIKLYLVKRNKSKEKGETGMRVQSAVVATVLAVLVAVLFQLPSLSIDINGIFTYAFDVVNAFMPLIAIIAGLGLGFNLITKISSLFNRAL